MLRGLTLALCLLLGTTAAFGDAAEDCNQKSGDVAIKGCTELIRQNPRNANAYYNRGLAWKSKKEYDKALADYAEAIRLDPK